MRAIRDSQLVLGVSAHYEGAWVEINDKGLIGPEIPYSRRSDALRILYLGDSVTFGYGLPHYTDAYPYRVASLLAEATGREVETINAAVSGYSPWQEATYLETEGLRYRPDLIVVGFVLNDATEKFGLVRFGGSGLGWQLDHTTSNQLTAFLSRSATLYFAGRLIQRMRHGGDLEALAKDEELARLYALLHKSETESVVRA